MAARDGAAGTETLEWARPSNFADPARRRAPAGFGQATGAQPAEAGVAAGHPRLRGGRLWREGGNAPLASRFAAVRVRPAHRDCNRSIPRPEEWCLIEWPTGEKEPTKYWLSTLPASTSRRELVDTAKLRWRIERDYQELKQELGLGHYEGRGWRGFHHHATPCIAAYGFLISERETIPPQHNATPGSSKRLAYPEVIDPADPPIRPERHVCNSIASMRCAIGRAIARSITRCPCCQRATRRSHLMTQ